MWAVPIVALLIAGWLGYRQLAERGPTITISFETADGIEAGRTTVRYKNVDLGHVIKVGLSPDHSHALVTARMTREAEPLLRADTKFWVVRPRIGAKRHLRAVDGGLGPLYRHAAGQGQRSAPATLPGSKHRRPRKGWSAAKTTP